jgi:hypothetical protein
MSKYRLNYTETSLQDISDIGYFIAVDNQQRAMSFCDELFIKKMQIGNFIVFDK